MISLIQMRTFLAVARHRHFTHAAEELHVAQSSVSYHVRELERVLSVKLIETAGHRVFLTDAGERFVVRATSLLADLEDLEQEIHLYGAGVSGRLRLGATHTVGGYALVSVLAGFRRTYPKVDIRLTVENVRAVEQMLLDRSIDLGVVEWSVQSPDLTSVALRRYPIVLIAPPNHPLTRSGVIGVEELRGQTFVLREKGSGTRALSDDVLLPVADDIIVAMDLNQPEAIVRAVEAGMGLAFIPEVIAAPQLAAGSVCLISMANTDLGHHFSLVRLTERPLTPGMAAFQAFLTEAWAANGTAESDAPKY
jgi:DNA-binding transcriptional LysR family regulator